MIRLTLTMRVGGALLRAAAALALLAGARAFQWHGALPRAAALGRRGAVASSRPRAAARPRAGVLCSVVAQMVTREVLREGDGSTFPQEGDTLTVHYEGKLAREVPARPALSHCPPALRAAPSGQMRTMRCEMC